MDPNTIHPITPQPATGIPPVLGDIAVKASPPEPPANPADNTAQQFKQLVNVSPPPMADVVPAVPESLEPLPPPQFIEPALPAPAAPAVIHPEAVPVQPQPGVLAVATDSLEAPATTGAQPAELPMVPAAQVPVNAEPLPPAMPASPFTQVLQAAGDDGTRYKKPMTLFKQVKVGLIATIFIAAVAGTTVMLERLRSASPDAPVATLSREVQEQDLSLEVEAAPPSSLQFNSESLVVNGDLVTTGALKLYNDTYFANIVQGTTSGDHVYTLPDADGTFCLDNNNCGFTTPAQVTAAVQNGISQLPASGSQNLQAGTGVDITNDVISNTGIISLNGQAGAVTLSGGSGITVSGLTVVNTGVTSLGGENGDVDLVAGDGVSVAGLTITNTGVTSLGGLAGDLDLDPGDGISVSGLTVTNTGVLSLAGQTGTLDLISGPGISISGLTISNNGVTSVQGLTGNVTFTAGAGISLGGGTAITNAGVTSLTGTANQIAVSASTGGVTLTLPQDIGTASAPTFGGLTVNGTIGANTITPTAALTIGATSQTLTLQGSNTTISATNGANTAQLTFEDPTADVTYQLPVAAAGTYDLCSTSGNCSGVGGGVTTAGGTPGTIALFTSSQGLGDSIITDSGTAVTISGDLDVTGIINGQILSDDAHFTGNVTIDLDLDVGGELVVGTISSIGALTVGATGQDLLLQGSAVTLSSTDNGITNSLVFATPSGSNKIITIPNASGTVCLTAGNCAGVGGTGDILQDGNSFNADMTIGTNDAYALNLETAGAARVTILADGKVGIGTESPSATLHVAGETLLKNQTDSGIAFQIQNAAGTSLVTADTANLRLGIGPVGGFSDTITKLPDPASLPASTGNGTAFSPDGVYMAVAHANSPRVTIYKRSGDTFTKLTNPVTLPVGTANGVAFSPDGTYVSVVHATTPFVTIYKRSGDTFTKLADPATLPAGVANGVAFSPDGTYMSVAHFTNPFVTIYKRSGDTFTKLADPATLPASSSYSVSFSPDSAYMAVGHSSSPYITIYKRSGDTFTKLTNPAALPPSTPGRSIAFSPDGIYMSVAHDNSPYITIYKRSGDTFTKLTNPAALPTDDANGVAFSPDSTYLAVSHDTSPYITIYKRSGDTFTKLADPATLPAFHGNSVAFSPDGTYMSVAHSSTPSVTIYKGTGGISGRLEIATSTTAEDGLSFGKEIKVYRSAPNELSLSAGNSLKVQDGGLTVQGNSLFTGRSSFTGYAAFTDNVGIGLADDEIATAKLQVAAGTALLDNTYAYQIKNNADTAINVLGMDLDNHLTLGAASGMGNLNLYAGTGAITLGTSTASAAVTVLNGGNVGIGEVDPGAKLQVNAAASGIGLIVQGSATTPGDLQEWQNSSGVTLASISASGVLRITAEAGGPLPLASAIALRGSGATPTIAVNGNYATSTLAVYDVYGGAMLNWATGGTGDVMDITQLGKYTLRGSADRNNVLLSVRASNVQSADLQQWQNSSGTVLAQVGADGGIVISPSSNSTVGMTINAPSGSTANLINATIAGGPALQVRAIGGNPYVGINATATAGNHFMVYGGGQVAGYFQTFEDGNVLAGSGASIVLQNISDTDGDGSKIQFRDADGNIIAAIGGTDISASGSTGTLQFATSGSTRLTINETGDVGIGIATPSTKLQVQGDLTVAGRLVFNAQTDSAVINRPSAGASLWIGESADSGQTFFRGSGATTFEGSVGVGTASPTTKLDVRGDALFRNGADTTNAFLIQNSATTNLFTADTTNMRVGIGPTGGFSDTVTKLADPASLPTGSGNDAAFSSDGTYMAVAHQTSPFITIYKRSGDTFTKLSDPASLPDPVLASGVAFSPDGTYLGVAHFTSPYVSIYKRSGDTFTKLSNPASLPTGSGDAITFSPDGVYMSVAHATTPFITIYKRSGDTFTKLSNPASLPASNAREVDFSPDGAYMSVAHNNSPFITIYKRSGDTFTKLSNPASLPASTGRGVAFSPDGTYMSVAHSTTPFITIYKRSGDTFTKLSDPASLPASTGMRVDFSPDGIYLAVAQVGSPYIALYKRSGDTFTKLSDPPASTANQGTGVTFSPDGTYLAFAHSTSPYVTIYKGSGTASSRLEIASSTTAAEGIGFGKEIQLYRSAPGELSLSAGSSLNIQQGNLTVQGTSYITGNVGIGQATPAAKLDLLGDTAGDALSVSNSTSSGNIALFKDNTTTVVSIADGGAALFKNSANSTAAFQVQNASGATILGVDTTNGRVGIGTSSPDVALVVQQVSAPTIKLSQSSIATVGGSISSLDFAANANTWAAATASGEDVRHFTRDSTNGVIYVGVYSGSHPIRRCVSSTGCDSGGEWTTSNTNAGDYITGMTFDSVNNVLYVTTYDQVLRCATSTGCDANGEWTTSYNPAGVSLYSVVADSAGGDIFAGSSSGGFIYRCATSSGCDEDADWSTSYDSSASTIESLFVDHINGVVYAGGNSGGLIYRCANSTGCDEDADWTTGYDSPSSTIYSFTYDFNNGVVYAGGTGGLIHRCATSTGCDADTDWSLSYDSPAITVSAMAFDSVNNVVYAGDANSDDIYRCASTSQCDAASDWTVSYTVPSQARIPAMIFDPVSTTVFAGNDSGGVIYMLKTSGVSSSSTAYARITAQNLNTESNTATGSLGFKTAKDGALIDTLYLQGDKIGINTVAPDVTLHIADATTASLKLQSTATSASGSTIGQLSFAGGLSSWTTSYDSPDFYAYSMIRDTDNSVIYAGTGQNGIIYRCATSTSCDEASDWTTSYDSPASEVYALSFDNTNNVIYAGTNSAGIIYRCATSTSCDEASDWTTSYDSSATSIRSLAIDIVNGVIYAGTTSAGIIYRCATSTSCNEDSDWTTSYDSPASEVNSMLYDSETSVLYAGTDSSGIIYRCATSTSCDEDSDWTTGYDSPASRVDSLAYDSSNNVIYAGTSASGIIYRCATATACDASGDWSVSYDSSESNIYSLVVDTSAGVLYAGSNSGGIIYRCATSTNCDETIDWTTSFDSSESNIRSLLIDTTNSVLYAGTGGNGVIYRCATSTGCGATLNYGQITAKASLTNGTNAGTLSFNTLSSGVSTEAMTIQGGNVGIGTSAPGGLLALNKSGAASTDVLFKITDATGQTHGITDAATTDTLFQITKQSSAGGGIYMQGLSDAAGETPFILEGAFGVTDPTDAQPAIAIRGAKRSGTAKAALGASETVLVVQNWGTNLMTIVGSGGVRFNTYGAGTLVTDGSGNITASSDEQLKNLQGNYTRGLADILNIDPILYKWNDLSGMETENTYAGFSAQDVQGALPEAVGTDPRGYLTLQDRPILAATVNAIKELDTSLNDLEDRVGVLEAATGSTPEFTSLNVSGNTTLHSLTVVTVKVTGNLTVAGHIQSHGQRPSVSSTDGTVEVEGTDTAGTVTYEADAGSSQGALATVMFAAPYSYQPRIVITATNEDGSDLPVYVQKISGGFKIIAKTDPVAGKTYSFDYIVVGAQASN